MEMFGPGAAPRRSLLLQKLFPSGVSATELRMPAPSGAYGEQYAEILGRSPLQFAREVAAGRLCMRRAVEDLEARLAPQALAEAASLTGCITHAEGFCAAVVGERRRFQALGLNAQICSRVTQALWPDFLTAPEMIWLKQLASSQQAAAASVLLAAKEAFYQCYYILTNEWLEPGAVNVHCTLDDIHGGRFSVRAERDLTCGRDTLEALDGRFCFRRGLVVTAVAVPA
jgi:4'-phosphopantetheinyl transferase EntD